MEKKKLLTIEDLISFCQNHNFTKFSSKDLGYQLAIQVPTSFQLFEESNDDHRGMLKLKFRILHDGLNRNGSYVSKKAADKASSTIADRPILAAIHQLDDGSWDFHAHDREIIEDEDGNAVMNYIEKQVGSFSSDPAFWEYDEETKKNYLCAYGYIPEDYTRAADIIREKDGWTKNSCELQIENMAYNANKKRLELNQFYLSASTLLGAEPDGTKIDEGMLGSRADIVDFSTDNNQLKFEANDELKQFIQDSVKEALDNIQNIQGKEEPNMVEFEENVEVTETSENEEVVVEEAATNEEDVVEEATTEESNEEVTVTEAQSEEPAEVTPSEEKFTKVFEISHEDIRYALYNLLAEYEAMDNEWYGITAVYDDSFVYEGWCNPDNKFRQGYKKDGDNISFEGERVHMNVEYLTDSELVALNDMRSNYSAIQEELSKFHAEPEKMEILCSEDYSAIADSEEFAELKKQEAHFDLSVDEVKAKADEMLLTYAKQHGVESFAKTTEESKTQSKPIIPIPAAKRSRYGGIFSK